MILSKYLKIIKYENVLSKTILVCYAGDVDLIWDTFSKISPNRRESDLYEFHMS